MTVAAPERLQSAFAARLLALLFVPPDGEHLERIGLLTDILAADDVAAVEIRAALADVGLPELVEEHERLFGIDGACVPYEGSWEEDPFREWRNLADVSGFYAACGAVTGGLLADRADHAGCELEYLAFLWLRETEARDADAQEDAAVCAEAAATFLREHLGRFLPTLLGEVQGCTTSLLYAALARFGLSWIEQELAARGLEPRPVVRRRGRLDVEQEQLVCGSDCVPSASSQLVQLERRGGSGTTFTNRRPKEDRK